MSLKILITGGTIDDLEYDSPENAPTSHKSLVPDLVEQARLTTEYSIETLILKDSKFITDTDREKIARSCESAPEDQIVITHGTMTMSDTAKFLGKRNIQKTIVLLGAAIPANKKNSDALFNLGAAVTAAQILGKGVYVTMNGKVFDWKGVRKNFEEGTFENASLPIG